MTKWPVIGDVGLVILGLLLASQITIGVALVGAGASLAVLARIWQAGKHHEEAGNDK